MKLHSYISFFLITSMLLVGGITLASFTEAPSNMPNSSYDGYSVPSNNPATSIFDEGATTQYKPAGVALSVMAVGKTGYVAIDTSGRVGVNTSTPSTGVRMTVTGSIASSSVSGTGISKICTGSTNGSSTDGYPLTRC